MVGEIRRLIFGDKGDYDQSSKNQDSGWIHLATLSSVISIRDYLI